MPHDQRETPYLDAALRYRATGYTPFHTPGHKLGKGAPAGLREFVGDQALGVDLAMAGGVEDTRESTGLIRLAEDYAAEAWGSDRAWFLVNGSSSGVHALLLALGGPGETVIVPRNAHKSLLAGLIFTGSWPLYMEPAIDPLWGVPLQVRTSDALAALEKAPDARALFVTSPTYNGLGADLPGIGELAHRAGVPFVTDQAWGPHLRFCPELPVDAMTAGADAAVVSTHKLISGLTQSAVLLARDERLNLARLDGMVHMTQSTSPQVLMYVSIDAARQQMAVHGAELWRHAIELADRARERIGELAGLRCLGRELVERNGVTEFDPTRLTVSACDLGLSGYQLETVLRDEYRIAVEAADPLNIVLNVTFGDSRDDLDLLVGALRDLSARYADAAGDDAAAKACSTLLAQTPPFTRQVLSPRDAVFAAAVARPLHECAGEVSAEMVTPYPPGIPVLGPGEAVSPEIVAYLREASATGLKVHGPEDRTLRTLRVIA
ncbi:MAG TPA: aminotransferase class V-fold PLP-dependent enzyme [Thermoleophilia bacterium]|nr:aminotransferase class V-fold PLP-dependent enzyme [Thermoleophilia bacterium]